MFKWRNGYVGTICLAMGIFLWVAIVLFVLKLVSLLLFGPSYS
jgi:hypothetical protein